jgi:hypothetical protein
MKVGADKFITASNSTLIRCLLLFLNSTCGRCDMHTVMWTFKVPTGTSKAQLIETINATAHTYEGIPGLIRKYYGIAPDGGSLVGIYLWESVVAANAFYTPDWVAMVTKRWAGPPQRQEWETPMVVESAERRLVAAE